MNKLYYSMRLKSRDIQRNVFLEKILINTRVNKFKYIVIFLLFSFFLLCKIFVSFFLFNTLNIVEK